MFLELICLSSCTDSQCLAQDAQRGGSIAETIYVGHSFDFVADTEKDDSRTISALNWDKWYVGQS